MSKEISTSIKELKELVNTSNNIVFLGGAGVSTASGIPDYRSKDGLYTTSKMELPEYLLSNDCLMKETNKFYDFLKTKMIYKDAKPNNAHIALKELEDVGKLKAVITQNIDGLHQAAGSKEVLEIHGTLASYTCTGCNEKYDLDFILDEGYICPDCEEMIRPDVTLYGEFLNTEVYNKAIDYIVKADLIIIGGTSMNVYPFADLVHYSNTKNIVIINKGETQIDNWAKFIIRDDIDMVFKEVRECL